MRWWKTPASKSLAIQFVSALTLWLIHMISQFVPHTDTIIHPVVWVLAQSSLALLISQRALQETWWLAIHFIFPFAVYLMLQLEISNHLYLVAFVLCLGLFWSSVGNRVPYYPSRQLVWDEVLSLLPQDKPVRMIDIGSGLGGLVMTAARKYPQLSVTGIETAPLIWAYSVLRATLTRSRAQFLLGNYENLDLGHYDFIFAYLSPAAMPALMTKCDLEMQRGAVFISHEFPFPDITPTMLLDHGGATKPSYVYRMS